MKFTSERDSKIRFVPDLARALAVASPMPIEAPVCIVLERSERIWGSVRTTRAVCPVIAIVESEIEVSKDHGNVGDLEIHWEIAVVDLMDLIFDY